MLYKITHLDKDRSTVWLTNDFYFLTIEKDKVKQFESEFNELIKKYKLELK